MLFERPRPHTESKIERQHSSLDQFVHALSIVAHERLTLPEPADDTYELDTDAFTLSFVVDDETFEIRNIEARRPGAGKEVVRAVHEYADEHGLAVIASNVKDGAQGFWRRMGYEEGDNGEFYRIA